MAKSVEEGRSEERLGDPGAGAGVGGRREMAGDASGGSVLARVRSLFRVAIGVAFPRLSEPPIAVAEASKPQFGDYQCNSAMAIAQVFSFCFYPFVIC